MDRLKGEALPGVLDPDDPLLFAGVDWGFEPATHFILGQVAGGKVIVASVPCSQSHDWLKRRFTEGR